MAKIGTSTCEFSYSTMTRCKSYKGIPKEKLYWKLYSRPTDCIAKEIGHDWKSDRALPYQEVIDYLTNFKGERHLIAFARSRPKSNIRHERKQVTPEQLEDYIRNLQERYKRGTREV